MEACSKYVEIPLGFGFLFDFICHFKNKRIIIVGLKSFPSELFFKLQAGIYGYIFYSYQMFLSSLRKSLLVFQNSSEMPCWAHAHTYFLSLSLYIFLFSLTTESKDVIASPLITHPRRRPLLQRVLCAALPLQVLLLLLLGVACLVPVCEDDSYTCLLSNNMRKSLTPMLHYTQGAPPT